MKYSEKTLRASMSIPSITHSYSIAINYMQNWFLDKFQKDFFKNVHIDGKHILDDFRDYDITKKVKIPKPNLSIIPQLDTDFNRQYVDLYQYGVDNYIKQTKIQDTFFKDTEKNLYLGTNLKMMQMNFIFRSRFQTRAQQLDAFEYMNMACRAGASQGKEITIDYHIPYGLILQLANDAGFELTTDTRVSNPTSFLSYFNSHSMIPIIFKYRPETGRLEYFLRFQDIYMRIYTPQLPQPENGEQVGQLQDNFVAEVNSELQMPTIKMYMYYSSNKHDFFDLTEKDSTAIKIATIKLAEPPDRNDKGWEKFLYTTCELDKLEDTKIEFKELFIEDNDLISTLNYMKEIKISPAVFLDIKLFNNGNEISYKINWDTLTISIDKVTDYMINMFIYMDVEFINNLILSKKTIENKNG